MSDSASPESAPLSVDEAVASLTHETPVEDAAEAAPVEAAAEAEENTEGETSAPEEAEDGDEPPAEEDDAKAEDPAVEPLEPPRYWSQDAKARFAELTPELQAVVLEQEGPREAAAAKVKAEAAEIRQQAEAEKAKVQQFAQAIGPKVEEWTRTFQSRWPENPDWVAYAQEHGVEAMTLTKLQHDQEAKALDEARQTQRVAEADAHQAYLQAEAAKLPELAPDLADPVKGAERRAEVGKFLIGLGIEKTALANISAAELSLAYDAMRFRQAKTQITAPPKPRPAAPAARTSPVRPAAAQAQSPTQRTALSAQNRFNAKPDIDNAVALLLNKKA